MGYYFTDLSQPHTERSVVMTHQEIRFHIVNGPSKFNLMTAQFAEEMDKKGAGFTVALSNPLDKFRFRLVIIGMSVKLTPEQIKRREEWNIFGYGFFPYDLPDYFRDDRGGQSVRNDSGGWFEAYYDGRTRTGWIKNVPMPKEVSF